MADKEKARQTAIGIMRRRKKKIDTSDSNIGQVERYGLYYSAALRQIRSTRKSKAPMFHETKEATDFVIEWTEKSADMNIMLAIVKASHDLEAAEYLWNNGLAGMSPDNIQLFVDTATLCGARDWNTVMWRDETLLEVVSYAIAGQPLSRPENKAGPSIKPEPKP